MCLITFAYQSHPDYNLILVANRDEAYERATLDAAPWRQDTGLVAGQDLEQGGTWLGIHRSGRLGAVTNHRDGRTSANKALRSRGHLTRDFLLSREPAASTSQRYAEQGEEYGGFNLLLGDREGLYYLSNRGRTPERLTPGIYGLSNALLDSPWPKLLQARNALDAALGSINADQDMPPLAARLTEVLACHDLAPDDQLPDTGISRELERKLSSCFIQLPQYGTRATTVILQDYQGNSCFYEQSFDAAGPTAARHYSLQLPLIGGDP
ncbi:NRDE family protein [Marinobacterium rhizophilum]|uniref:NRDE family protein n=1 Tax=Marinobacterium rhizophilum TaxID=420402 RepID=A0ABY5HI99_9GAMM|nr:NRDE family protein [Marinobacterium rhizophilum]UTW11014.1 NRDE family protein [Marinobacterium rhizophilum]